MYALGTIVMGICTHLVLLYGVYVRTWYYCNSVYVLLFGVLYYDIQMLILVNKVSVLFCYVTCTYLVLLQWVYVRT